MTSGLGTAVVETCCTAPCRCTTAGPAGEVSTYQPGAPEPNPALPDQSPLSMMGMTGTSAPDAGPAYAGAAAPSTATATAAAVSAAAANRPGPRRDPLVLGMMLSLFRRPGHSGAAGVRQEYAAWWRPGSRPVGLALARQVGQRRVVGDRALGGPQDRVDRRAFGVELAQGLLEGGAGRRPGRRALGRQDADHVLLRLHGVGKGPRHEVVGALRQVEAGQ